MVGTPDGRRMLRAEQRGDDPETAGLALAEALRGQGADEIIAALASG
jgi:hydroxymethylbilane synthase